MTRGGGILASSTAAVLFVVGALVSAGGSDADAQAKKEAPLETKGRCVGAALEALCRVAHVMDPNSTRWGRYHHRQRQARRATRQSDHGRRRQRR